MFPGLLDIKINLKPDSHLTQPSQTGKTQTEKKKSVLKVQNVVKNCQYFQRLVALFLGRWRKSGSLETAEKWDHYDEMVHMKPTELHKQLISTSCNLEH